jgi:hypothetical protein
MTHAGSDKSRPEAYFEAAFQQFHDLAAVAGAVVARQVSLAGRTVRIEVSAGPMECAVLPPFSHLADHQGSEADLVLCAWDSESTAAPGLSPGWRNEDYRREGYISGFNDDRFHTALQYDPIILRILDMKRHQAAYWTSSALKLPYWEIAAPLRPLLHEWLKRIGLVAVHGGAVGREDGGVFLAGAGGRGKSNVALACLNSELFYASDDFCFLSKSPRWTIHSLYCTGKIAAGDLVRHPHLLGSVSNPDRLDREKALFFLSEKFGNRLIREMPLRAIVLPHVIAHGRSEIVPISVAVAQKEIALSTIELSKWAGSNTLIKVSELLRDLPAYELRLGESIEDVPPLLVKLLNEFRQRDAPAQ